MKLRRFNVSYNTTTSFDTCVYAASKKEAIAKVEEVVGPVVIEYVHELPVEVLTDETKKTKS